MKLTNQERILNWKLYDRDTQFIGSPENDVDHAVSIRNNARKIRDEIETVTSRPTLLGLVGATARVAKGALDIAVHASFAGAEILTGK